MGSARTYYALNSRLNQKFWIYKFWLNIFVWLITSKNLPNFIHFRFQYNFWLPTWKLNKILFLKFQRIIYVFFYCRINKFLVFKYSNIKLNLTFYKRPWNEIVIFTCVLGERYSFGKFIATPNFVHDFTLHKNCVNNKFVNVYMLQ